jgi:hypothetical protein
MNTAPGIGAAQQCVHGADEMPVGGDVDRHHLLNCGYQTLNNDLGALIYRQLR